MKATSIYLEKHVRALTDGIGIRLAGSRQEYQAAEYIARAFRQYSSRTIIEEYPVRQLNAGIFHRHGVYYVELTEPCPYTDQIPFAACSVPGMRILTVFTDRNRTGTVGL